MRFLIHLVITAAALWAATHFVSGISYQGGVGTLLLVALIFGVINALVRPIVKLFSFPLVLLTLGLFTFIINACMLWLTSALSRSLGIGFHVAGFGPAFWGALVVSLVSFALSLVAPVRPR